MLFYFYIFFEQQNYSQKWVVWITKSEKSLIEI